MGLGGTQRVTLNLIKWLTQNTEHKISLVIESTAQKGEFEYGLDGIRCVRLEDNTYKKIKSLRRLVNSYSPDIVITMGLPNAIFDVPALFNTGVKHIISERNDPRNFSGKKVTKWLSRFLACFADGYVFQTKEAKEYYSLKCFSSGIVIPNPLLGTENMPSTIFNGSKIPQIVTAGRLNKQKNLELLIRAFNKIHVKFPSHKLVIYGEGPERKNLENLIHTLHLENAVSMPGSVQNVIELIYDKELFILSSDFEGMPNVLMEAMSLGLPCISTNCPCGGPAELITDGYNGLLIPVNDETALTSAISRLLTDSFLSEKLSKNAFKIREIFDLDVISRQWLNYIIKVSNK